MLKKIIFSFFIFLVIGIICVNASINSLVKIGNNYYDSLEEAILNASSTDVINLISNVNLDKSLDINKTVNINLNGHDITAPEMVFQVQGGVLNLTGKGTIKESEPNLGAIVIKGSNNSSDKDYSIVNVSKDVTLEGWSGIFVNHGNNTAYGVVVNLDGKINSVNDTSGGEGIGVYVNGNIQHKDNVPVINIKDNAVISSTGNGLYLAGNTVTNIGKAHITGVEAGIGMKAGKLNIDGATVICTGEDKTPTEGYNNGIKASGVTIQVESNTGYANNMEINISSGNFISNNSNVFYEYIGKGTSSLVNDINISGGSFLSKANKDVFLLSNSFKGLHSDFITGGSYSSDPSSYLKSGYSASLENNMYNVTKSSAKLVSSDSVTVSGGGNVVGTILIILVLTILVVIAYFNRNKILNLFKK